MDALVLAASDTNGWDALIIIAFLVFAFLVW